MKEKPKNTTTRIIEFVMAYILVVAFLGSIFLDRVANTQSILFTSLIIVAVFTVLLDRKK